MAIQPTQDRNDSSTEDDFIAVGPDATATFEPSGSSSDPTEHASSENLGASPRTPALDEEDDLEDDDEDPDKDDDLDDDDDLEDDEEEEDESEDEEDLEDEDEDEDDEDDEEEEEDEDEDA